MYKIKNLTFSYNKSNIILNNISFNINEGDLYIILGKNGIGKTTLFNCLLNFNKNYKGEILLNGINIRNLKEKELASIVSFVPQSSNCTFDYTVFEYILMGTASSISLFSKPSQKQEKQVNKVLNDLKIKNLSNRKFNSLSGGEQQLVLIARSLVNNPKIIFLDEPTAHLDYENQIKVLKILKKLKENKYTIVLTTHDPNHAFILNGKVILFNNNKKIKKGETKKILTKKNLQQVYGKELEVLYQKKYKRNYVIYPNL